MKEQKGLLETPAEGILENWSGEKDTETTEVNQKHDECHADKDTESDLKYTDMDQNQE